jgi:hypothetical protein
MGLFFRKVAYAGYEVPVFVEWMELTQNSVLAALRALRKSNVVAGLPYLCIQVSRACVQVHSCKFLFSFPLPLPHTKPVKLNFLS